MKKFILLIFATLFFSGNVAWAVNPIVVDHNSVVLFESIPDEYLQAARSTSMLFIDQSVGLNINEGLTCLSYPTDELAPNHCKRYNHPVSAYSVSPSEVNWTKPYTRTNWAYQTWAGNCGSYWYDLANCFINMPLTQSVVSFQFSYLQVQSGSNINSSPGGFFYNNSNRADIYDLVTYETQNPNKVVIYWTTSLARSIGTSESETFNNQMRTWAIANNKILFDVADILSHDVSGQPCYDNRDGIPYQTENYPDDGQNYPAICQQYTTEVNGGHLGSVSVGKIRVAKAFWVLMAQIAGWTP